MSEMFCIRLENIKFKFFYTTYKYIIDYQMTISIYLALNSSLCLAVLRNLYNLKYI